ncbi:hypothetical protein G7Y79_00014g037650 [Physcia stellaris]|nr:hypothetical protein G7Y79_00014g037650 [Physcia stellaris]
MGSHPSNQNFCLTRLSSDADTSKLQVKLRDALASDVKIFPPEMLWNDAGLMRFEAIRTAKSLDYYPSRKENQIIEEHANPISQTIPMKATIIELGSGNIEKTALLLSALQRQGKTVNYYALDISSEELLNSLDRLEVKFRQGGGINCHGLLGSYDDLIPWLEQKLDRIVSPVIFFWLGNSIANYCSRDAAKILTRLVSSKITCELRFIIGADGCQELSQIERCYTPGNPLTRDFLMNGLRYANDLAGLSLFHEEDWACVGCYDSTDRTWKDYYVARRDLEMDLLGTRLTFARDERMLCIRSAKWTEYDIASIARKAGLIVKKSWKDTDNVYGVYLLCQEFVRVQRV